MMRKTLSILLLYCISIVITLLPLALMTAGINGDVMPYLALCILYFYALHYQIGAWQMFLYGIFTGEAYGTPPGIDALLFVVLYVLVVRYKSVFLSQKPLSIFIGFACVAAVFSVVKYGMISEYYNYEFDVASLLIQYITTMLFYPALQIVMQLGLRFIPNSIFK